MWPVSTWEGMFVARRLKAHSLTECSALNKFGLKEVFQAAARAVIPPPLLKLEQPAIKLVKKKLRPSPLLLKDRISRIFASRITFKMGLTNGGALSNLKSFAPGISGFDILPEYCSFEILSYLTFYELMTLQRVSKQWKILADDNKLWESLFRPLFPCLEPHILSRKISNKNADDYKISYKEAFRLQFFGTL